jgi:DNA-binding transcriptional MocR family regulator
VALTTAAARLGIGIKPLSSMSLDDEPCSGLLLGYGRLRPDAIDDAVAALAACLAETANDAVAAQTSSA